MKNLIGMAIGAALDRRDGDSGVKGAIMGSVVQSLAKAAVPLAIVGAVGWGLLHLTKKAAGKAADAVDPSPSAKDIHVD